MRDGEGGYGGGYHRAESDGRWRQSGTELIEDAYRDPEAERRAKALRDQRTVSRRQADELLKSNQVSEAERLLDEAKRAHSKAKRDRAEASELAASAERVKHAERVIRRVKEIADLCPPCHGNEGEHDECGEGDDWTTSRVDTANGETVEIIEGAEGVVLVPSGGQPRALRVRYALYPVSAVIPSHDPWSFREHPSYDQSLQERDYWTQEAERQKVVRGATNFEPRFVLNSVPTALDGPPVILRHGPVMGGNGRTMMIKRSMAETSEYAEALREAVDRHGEVFGLVGADTTDRMLVRVLLDEVTAEAISSELNAPWTQHIDQFSGAASIGQRLLRELFLTLGDAVIESTLGEAIRGHAENLIKMLRKAGVITPQSETQWLGLDGTTGRPRIDRFSAEGAETLRLGIAGAFVGDKRVLAKSNARLRDLYERMAPVAMALDTLDSELAEAYNVTPYFRIATREVWRVASMSDVDMAAHYANESISFEEGEDDGLKTPEEVFTDPMVAAALVWLREYARGSRVEGARRLLDYWRAIPLELRDPSVNVMFPAEAPSPETLREDVLGMASTARIARMGVREYLGGGARQTNP